MIYYYVIYFEDQIFMFKDLKHSKGLLIESWGVFKSKSNFGEWRYCHLKSFKNYL